MSQRSKPTAAERGEYYQQYIDKVEEDDLMAAFQAQSAEIEAFLAGLDEATASTRYAEGKWTVKEVLGHVIDSERVFAYRAMGFARGEEQSLPGFDENEYVAASGFADRSLESIRREFLAVRTATIELFAGLDPAVLSRVGTANAQPMSARAAGFVMVGHTRHHFGVIRDRYL